MARQAMLASRRLVTAALVFTLLITLWNTISLVASVGQGQKKVVEQQSLGNEPVQLVELKTNGKIIKLGTKFDADEWMKHLSLKIKNISNKPIVYVGMYYDFPETKSSGNIMAYPLRFGQRPDAKVISGTPGLLMPGEVVEVTLTDQEYDKLKRFLEERHSIASLHRASLRITDVYFEDGTLWSNGDYYRHDPANPQKWILIEGSQSNSSGD